jgi:hypothetical protein
MTDGPARRRSAILLPLALCLGAFALYAAVAAHLLPSVLLGHGPFNADTRTSAHDFLRLRYEWKHPLMSPVEFGATALFRLMLEPPQAIVAAIAALASLDVLLVYGCLRRVGLAPLAATLGGALFAVAFSNLAILGVPESYTVSTLAMLLFLLAWLGPAGGRRLVLLGLLAGVAGLANLPLLSLAALPVLQALLDGRPRRAAAAALIVGGIALAMVGAAALAYGLIHRGAAAGGFAGGHDYLDRYAAAGRLLVLGDYVDVLSCFLLFGVATPAAIAVGPLTARAAGGYLGHATGLLGAVGAVVLCGLAAAGTLGPQRRIVLPLAAWLLSLTAFYVYFKPSHAMVYGVQAQPALAIMAALGAGAVLRRPRPIAATLAVILVMVAACNLPGGSLQRFEGGHQPGAALAAPPT